MAPTNMKRVAGEALATYIGARVAGLVSVAAAQSGPEEFYDTPTVRLLPEIMTFEPTQSDEVYENATTDDGKVIVDVGQFTGKYTLQLWTKSKPEREQYEQAILDLFLADTWAPGTIFADTPNLTVAGYVSLFSTQIKARLDSEEWREEMAFESHRFTYLEILIDFPALTTVAAANMVDLELLFSSDFTAVITSTAQIDGTDKVQIQADGSTTQVP